MGDSEQRGVVRSRHGDEKKSQQQRSALGTRQTVTTTKRGPPHPGRRWWHWRPGSRVANFLAHNGIFTNRAPLIFRGDQLGLHFPGRVLGFPRSLHLDSIVSPSLQASIPSDTTMHRFIGIPESGLAALSTCDTMAPRLADPKSRLMRATRCFQPPELSPTTMHTMNLRCRLTPIFISRCSDLFGRPV